MITLPEIEKYKFYESLEFEPIKIKAVYKYGASRQNYQPQTLDNLLARQVVEQATNGRGLPDVSECYDIHLPLKCLWRNKNGWPLWAASYFWPTSETYQWSLVQHKRAITGHWSYSKNKTITINKANGKHKEKRIPIPVETSLTGEYVAYAIGHFDTICELLNNVSQLSGRRNIGLGIIDYFEMSIIDYADVLIVNNKLARSIPLEASELLPKNIKIAENCVPSVGWTPPQWKPTLFSPGWFAGTPVEVNYFEIF